MSDALSLRELEAVLEGVSLELTVTEVDFEIVAELDTEEELDWLELAESEELDVADGDCELDSVGEDVSENVPNVSEIEADAEAEEVCVGESVSLNENVLEPE